VENPPAVTAADGAPATLTSFPHALGRRGPEELDLAPGKEVELATLTLELRPESEVGRNGTDLLGRPRGREGAVYPTLFGAGKFRVRYERLTPVGSDTILGKLATGELELDVRGGGLSGAKAGTGN
jgi:hypothetical protein